MSTVPSVHYYSLCLRSSTETNLMSLCLISEFLSDMNHQALLLLFSLLCSSSLVDGGKILVFPCDGSHWVNMKVLIEELHSRGHEITVMRPSDSWYIKAESSYSTITLESPLGFDSEKFGGFVTKMLNLRRDGASSWSRIALEYELVEQFYQLHKHMVKLVGDMFEDAKMMQGLRDAKYDLVLTDPAIGAGVLLAHRGGGRRPFTVWVFHWC